VHGSRNDYVQVWHRTTCIGYGGLGAIVSGDLVGELRSSLEGCFSAEVVYLANSWVPDVTILSELLNGSVIFDGNVGI